MEAGVAGGRRGGGGRSVKEAGRKEEIRAGRGGEEAVPGEVLGEGGAAGEGEEDGERGG